MNPEELTPPQQRSILLELKFRVGNRNQGELCARYEMTMRDLKRLRQELGHQFASHEELVIAGVWEGAHTIDSLIGYLDYRDHARYPESEVREFLDNLVGIGVLVEDCGEWRFTEGAPAASGRFVFTAPEGAACEPDQFERA